MGVKKIIITIWVLGLLFVSKPPIALAQEDPNTIADKCSEWGVSVISGLNGIDSEFASGSKNSHTIILNVSSLDPNQKYHLQTYDKLSIGGRGLDWVEYKRGINPASGRLEYTLTQRESLRSFRGVDDKIAVFLGRGVADLSGTGFGIGGDLCYAGSYTITNNSGVCGDIVVSQLRNGNQCYSNSCIRTGEIQVDVTGLKELNGTPYTKRLSVIVKQDGLLNAPADKYATPVNGAITTTHTINTHGSYTITVEEAVGRKNINCPKPTFIVEDVCDDASDPNLCSQTPASAISSFTTEPFQLCKQIKDPIQYEACTKCAGGADGVLEENEVATGIWTAVGCIPTNATSIVQTLIKIGLSVAGGVALLMILAASFIFSTSQGDAKRTNEAKELITSAVIGLLFIIFSVTMLQFVGISVLHIPGFGSS